VISIGGADTGFGFLDRARPWMVGAATRELERTWTCL
jgi:hypothetical protein